MIAAVGGHDAPDGAAPGRATPLASRGPPAVLILDVNDRDQLACRVGAFDKLMAAPPFEAGVPATSQAVNNTLPPLPMP